MPLSKPAAREHIHTREIRCHGYRREDGLWDIEASLVDSKTYAFENKDRGTIEAGEPVHGMHIRLSVDDDLTVQAAEAATDFAPFDICANVTGGFAALAGLRIGPGWRKAVLQRMGGASGCTHLTDLLLGPLAVVAFQTVRPVRDRRQNSGPTGRKPALLDTCHALACESPVVKREWPDFYSGP